MTFCELKALVEDLDSYGARDEAEVFIDESDTGRTAAGEYMLVTGIAVTRNGNVALSCGYKITEEEL